MQTIETNCESHLTIQRLRSHRHICSRSGESAAWRHVALVNRNRPRQARQTIFKQTHMCCVKKLCQTFPLSWLRAFHIVWLTDSRKGGDGKKRKDWLNVGTDPQGFQRERPSWCERLFTTPVQTKRWHVETLKDESQITWSARPLSFLRPLPHSLFPVLFFSFIPFIGSFYSQKNGHHTKNRNVKMKGKNTLANQFLKGKLLHR